MNCPLCNRTDVPFSDHHLVPRCRGGGPTVTICQDCHSGLHKTFTNKELESTYNSVDALMAHEGFAKLVKFISKQRGRVKTDMPKNKRRRGRNG